jgi:YesN/AraC family two-component response regulator
MIASCNNQCRASDVLGLLCEKQGFDPDSRLHALCSVFAMPGVCRQPETCPAVFVFLGAHLDRIGLSAEEISGWVASFHDYLKNCGDINDIGAMTGLTLKYLNEQTETLLQIEERNAEKPSQYYTSIYEDREEMFKHFSYSLEEKLTLAVIKADEAAAMQAFREIKDSGNKSILAGDSVRSAKNSVICSCVLLTRAAIQAGVAPEEAFTLSDAVIKHIEDFNTCWDVLNYEEDVLMLFIRLIKKSIHDTVSLTTRRAIRYIDSHLSEKLALADIAAHVGVNRNYLSGLFHREMKMPLSEYVAARKIKESVYFLKYSSHAISDIATLYGFSDQSYYTAVFKKIMGVTPAAYRINVKKSKDR